MQFKQNKSKTNNSAITKAQSTSITPSSKVGAFKVNESFTGAIKNVYPEPLLPMIKELSQGLGVDLTDLSNLTKEQVIKLKEMTAGLDEKLMCMKELMPCILKYLSFQVSTAEFQAELTVQALKAKTKIDQAAAKAYVAYYRYLRKAQNLEKRINKQREIIDAAYNAFESVQDARSNAILSGLNQQARLGMNNAEHADELKQQRQQILSERRNKLQDLKQELKTSHLAS